MHQFINPNKIYKRFINQGRRRLFVLITILFLCSANTVYKVYKFFKQIALGGVGKNAVGAKKGWQQLCVPASRNVGVKC